MMNKQALRSRIRTAAMTAPAVIPGTFLRNPSRPGSAVFYMYAEPARSSQVHVFSLTETVASGQELR